MLHPVQLMLAANANLTIMTATAAPASPIASRPDFAAIAAWVQPGAKVLDLGCGDGSLLRYLRDARNIRGYGVEIDDANVLACLNNGVNVIQNDLESGLSGFESGSFDYVILSQTLQAMKHTEGIVREMLRVSREGIVSFPNFGYWKNRLQVVFGHMPVSETLPYQWFDTPNIHLAATILAQSSVTSATSPAITRLAEARRSVAITVAPSSVGTPLTKAVLPSILMSLPEYLP